MKAKVKKNEINLEEVSCESCKHIGVKKPWICKGICEKFDMVVDLNNSCTAYE